MPFSLSLKAYSKIVLHCCKYPHKAVNGVVIGSVSKKDQSVQIQDAIPLFHLGLGLAPMLEVALAQVEIYCNTKGLSIVGYYHANERMDDLSLADTALCIAAKVASNSEKACLLMVDNRIISEEQLGLKLYTKVESGTHWKEQNAPYVTLNASLIPRPPIPETGEVSFQTLLKSRRGSLIGEAVALRTVRKLVENRLFDQLVDFDNHLDCIQSDWTNPAINRAIDAVD